MNLTQLNPLMNKLSQVELKEKILSTQTSPTQPNPLIEWGSWVEKFPKYTQSNPWTSV